MKTLLKNIIFTYIHFHQLLLAACQLQILFLCAAPRTSSSDCSALIYTSDRWLILRRKMQILILAIAHLFLRLRVGDKNLGPIHCLLANQLDHVNSCVFAELCFAGAGLGFIANLSQDYNTFYINNLACGLH